MSSFNNFLHWCYLKYLVLTLEAMQKVIAFHHQSYRNAIGGPSIVFRLKPVVDETSIQKLFE